MNEIIKRIRNICCILVHLPLLCESFDALFIRSSWIKIHDESDYPINYCKANYYQRVDSFCNNV